MDQAVHPTMTRRQGRHSSFQTLKDTGPTLRVVGLCSKLMVSEEALKVHSMVSVTPWKKDISSHGTMALEITARGKKKALTATLEGDHTTVSEAEFTTSVAQAVTGSISRSAFFLSSCRRRL